MMNLKGKDEQFHLLACLDQAEIMNYILKKKKKCGGKLSTMKESAKAGFHFQVFEGPKQRSQLCCIFRIRKITV